MEAEAAAKEEEGTLTLVTVMKSPAKNTPVTPSSLSRAL